MHRRFDVGARAFFAEPFLKQRLNIPAKMMASRPRPSQNVKYLIIKAENIKKIQDTFFQNSRDTVRHSKKVSSIQSIAIICRYSKTLGNDKIVVT